MGALELDGAAPSGKARRIVDLRVDEVSNVDRPAIRRTFLVIKNLENEMGTFALSEDGAVAVDDDEMLSVVEEVTKSLGDAGFAFCDVEKAGLPPDLKAALGVAVPWLRKMAGQADGDTRKALLRVTAFLSKVVGGGYPYPSPQKKAKPVEDDEETKGKAKAKPDEEDEETKGRKTKATSLDQDDSGTVIKVAEDGTLSVVSKGRRFTPKRTAALADSASKILELLKETDEERYKQVLEQIGKELPKDFKWSAGVTASGTRTTKSEDDASEKILSAIQDLAGRVSAIEKTRAPSKSVDKSGGTDSTTKTTKSFWGNVL